MAVPGYQDFMLPMLRLAKIQPEITVAGAMQKLADEFQISEADQAIVLPSGTQTQFYNRVTWSITYLAKSLLLSKLARGRFRLTPRGDEVLAENPSRIDNKFLERFPEYLAFKSKRNEPRPDNRSVAGAARLEEEDRPVATPHERMHAAAEELRRTLADDLLQRVRAATPAGFERLVVRLLIAMGYGGGKLEQAMVTGRSGDEGIDGVIREDRLGLDMIYVQAKKWENTVGPGEIDKFVGSLMRKKATKGVFITSGSFTDGAERAAREAALKVRLIDGEELAELMIDFDLGVSREAAYVVKKVDSDFFDELGV
jgi:restriction system protein